jgi:hypothetical protein
MGNAGDRPPQCGGARIEFMKNHLNQVCEIRSAKKVHKEIDEY